MTPVAEVILAIGIVMTLAVVFLPPVIVLASIASSRFLSGAVSLYGSYLNFWVAVDRRFS